MKAAGRKPDNGSTGRRASQLSSNDSTDIRHFIFYSLSFYARWRGLSEQTVRNQSASGTGPRVTTLPGRGNRPRSFFTRFDIDELISKSPCSLNPQDLETLSIDEAAGQISKGDVAYIENLVCSGKLDVVELHHNSIITRLIPKVSLQPIIGKYNPLIDYRPPDPSQNWQDDDLSDDDEKWMTKRLGTVGEAVRNANKKAFPKLAREEAASLNRILIGQATDEDLTRIEPQPSVDIRKMFLETPNSELLEEEKTGKPPKKISSPTRRKWEEELKKWRKDALNKIDKMPLNQLRALALSGMMFLHARQAANRTPRVHAKTPARRRNRRRGRGTRKARSPDGGGENCDHSPFLRNGGRP